MFSRKTVVAVSGLLLVLSAIKAQVREEDLLKTLVKYVQNQQSTETSMIAAIQQAQSFCPNQTIDTSLAASTSSCLRRDKFGSKTIYIDGTLDKNKLFQMVCKIGAQQKKCKEPLTEALLKCWPQGHRLSTALNHASMFFCGEDNDGSRISQFLAHGGIKCVEAQIRPLKECFARFTWVFKSSFDRSDPRSATHGLFCDTLEHQHDCVSSHMDKCDNNVTQKLLTGMYKEVSLKMGCQNSQMIAGGSGKITVVLSWLIVPIILLA